jgi:hypothetical protein
LKSKNNLDVFLPMVTWFFQFSIPPATIKPFKDRRPAPPTSMQIIGFQVKDIKIGNQAAPSLFLPFT